MNAPLPLQKETLLFLLTFPLYILSPDSLDGLTAVPPVCYSGEVTGDQQEELPIGETNYHLLTVWGEVSRTGRVLQLPTTEEGLWFV